MSPWGPRGRGFRVQCQILERQSLAGRVLPGFGDSSSGTRQKAVLPTPCTVGVSLQGRGRSALLSVPRDLQALHRHAVGDFPTASGNPRLSS